MTVVGARSAPCVRCGRRPRTAGTFLCGPCLPLGGIEARSVEALAEGYQAQRRLMIERFHWAGGWSRKE